MHKKSKPQPAPLPPTARILDLLEHAGDWFSGEELADTLGVSRAAVAKRIAALRDAGHVIHSRTNKGYFLVIRAERIVPDVVARHLKTKVLGRRDWKVLDDSVSTNTDAIAWALDGAEEGAVVTAERQSRGKGRKGHDWFTSPRGLSVSVVLRPGKAKSVDGARYTRAALTAMREAVFAACGLKATIKTPNDLYLDGKKVCGILVESGMRGDEADWVVVGTGCNVNALPEDFPKAIRERVTSLYAAGGKVVSGNELLGRFLTALEPLLDTLGKRKHLNIGKPSL